MHAAVKLFNNAGFSDQMDLRNLDDFFNLAKALHGLGPRYFLLKGDQLPLTENLEVPNHNSDKQIIVNILYDGKDISLSKTAFNPPIGLWRDQYALACELLILEDMISPNNICPSCNRFESRAWGHRAGSYSQSKPIRRSCH